MSGIVFDTSIYISAKRRDDVSIFTSRRANRKGTTKDAPLWLSAVVLEELYAGAQDKRLMKLLSRLEKDFEVRDDCLLLCNPTGRPAGESWRSSERSMAMSKWVERA